MPAHPSVSLPRDESLTSQRMGEVEQSPSTNKRGSGKEIDMDAGIERPAQLDTYS